MIRDEATIKREKAVAQRIKQWEEARKHAQAILAQGKLMGPTATNLEAQMGRSMTHREFETRVRKVNPKFLCQQHPNNEDLMVLWFQAPAERLLVSPYGKGLMPEFSQFEELEEIVWNQSEMKSERKAAAGLGHVDRKDMPKPTGWSLEVETDPKSPEFMNTRGPGYTFDEKAQHPLAQKVKVPGRELVRGWRTVLAYALNKGFMTLAEMKAGFDDAADRESWAVATGRRAPATVQ